jgi:hypothetical protein
MGFGQGPIDPEKAACGQQRGMDSGQQAEGQTGSSRRPSFGFTEAGGTACEGDGRERQMERGMKGNVVKGRVVNRIIGVCRWRVGRGV